MAAWLLEDVSVDLKKLTRDAALGGIATFVYWSG
jgi:hypothetical protein